ncbi:hypothetical protein B0H14DRAFT_3442738 [Mycena olivaceomarginata]|nr:hypothetical protein B0H14DRAFT_3442738 [Mycena olivaceomarginata]
MSSPTDEIQKPPPLLLQSIAPHLLQSRKPLRRRVTTMNASLHTEASALEALAEVQAEVEKLKVVVHDRDLELSRLRSELHFAQMNFTAFRPHVDPPLAHFSQYRHGFGTLQVPSSSFVYVRSIALGQPSATFGGCDA